MQIVKTFAAAAVFSLCAMGAAAAQDLSGVWQGIFWGAGNAPTTFQATLVDEPGPGFSGSIVEVNNFGDMDAPFLLAVVSGRQTGANLSFVKTYDGTGSVRHSVSYDGRLVSDRRIVGTWSLEGASGQFELAR